MTQVPGGSGGLHCLVCRKWRPRLGSPSAPPHQRRPQADHRMNTKAQALQAVTGRAGVGGCGARCCHSTHRKVTAWTINSGMQQQQQQQGVGGKYNAVPQFSSPSTSHEPPTILPSLSFISSSSHSNSPALPCLASLHANNRG